MGLFGRLFSTNASIPTSGIHPDDRDLVRQADIEWWGSLSSKDREEMEGAQGLMRFGKIGELKRVGLSDIEITKKVRLEMTTFYWKIEERNQENLALGDFELDSADAKLPCVLGARIYGAIKNGVIDNESKKGATSVNALIRQLIRAGRFDM